jgi:hypothetical protein
VTKPERHERVWYHGSPYELTELAAGSTITPNRDLARAFSHKPTLVSIDDDGAIRHNGTRAGILYRVDEPLAPGDVYPHPRSAMPDGLEWLTRRPLRPHRIGRTRIRERERIAEKEIGEMMQRHKGVASAKMGPARGDDKSKETH